MCLLMNSAPSLAPLTPKLACQHQLQVHNISTSKLRLPHSFMNNGEASVRYAMKQKIDWVEFIVPSAR